MSFHKIYHIIDLMLLMVNIISLVIASNKWQLVWNDEFTGNKLDLNEWEVQNETEHCDGNSLEQLQCHTSRTKNVLVKDGVLALTAYKEKYLNKHFTGARIGTKRSFTRVKIEIRASLPLGALLRPAIWMLPSNRSQRWPLNGAIEIMVHDQTQLFTGGVHYFDTRNEYKGTEFNPKQLSENSSNTRLADYHVYSLVWTNKSIDWYFDHYRWYSVNIDKKLGDIYPNIGQPFDRDFRLYFQLAIGGIYFQENRLTDEQVSNWNCSLFIIDYIRIFKPISDIIYNQNFTHPFDDNTTSVNDICNEIMPDIRPKLSANRDLRIKDIAFIAVIVIIVIMSTLVIYLIVRRIGSLKSKLVDLHYDDKSDEQYDTIVYNDYSEVSYNYSKNTSEIAETDYTVILPPIDNYVNQI